MYIRSIEKKKKKEKEKKEIMAAVLTIWWARFHTIAAVMVAITFHSPWVTDARGPHPKMADSHVTKN